MRREKRVKGKEKREVEETECRIVTMKGQCSWALYRNHDCNNTLSDCMESTTSLACADCSCSLSTVDDPICGILSSPLVSRSTTIPAAGAQHKVRAQLRRSWNNTGGDIVAVFSYCDYKKNNTVLIQLSQPSDAPAQKKP